MAINIQIIPPLDQPTISNLNVLSGQGNFGAGDYRFAIFSMKGNRRTIPFIRSPLSNVIEVTLASNDNIEFDYSFTDDADNLCILYQKDGGKWEIQYTSNEYQHSSMNGHIVVNTRPWGYYSTILENYNYNNESYFGLKTDKGVGTIKVTGDGDFDLSDINTALNNSADAIEGEDYIGMGAAGLITTYGFDLKGCGAGNFTLTGAILYVYGGMSNAGSDLTIYSAYNYVSTAKICCPQRGGYWSGLELYNCDMENVVFDVGLINTTIGNYGAQNIYKGDINYGYEISSYSEAQPAFKKSIIIGSSRMGEYTLEGITTVGGNIYPRAANPVTAIDCIFYCTNSTYRVFWLPNPYNSEDIPKFYNCKFLSYYTGEQYSYENLGFYDHNLYSKIGYLHFLNTLDITIKDNDGEVIEGVTVTITNSQGEETELTTDENGNVNTDLLCYVHTNEGEVATSHLSTNANDINYNPFSITIQKDGFFTEIIELSLQNEFKQDVVLVPTIPPVYIDRTLSANSTISEVSASLSDTPISVDIDNYNISGDVTVNNISSDILDI